MRCLGAGQRPGASLLPSADPGHTSLAAHLEERGVIKVIIVGAGIGGLTAAIGLRRADSTSRCSRSEPTRG